MDLVQQALEACRDLKRREEGVVRVVMAGEEGESLD